MHSVDFIEQNRQQAAQLFRQEEYIRQLEEQIRQFRTVIDELTNAMALLKEDNQTLRDEIAFLKGQKPRPKIPPSTLEGAGKDKGKDKGKEAGSNPTRGKHPRKKKKTLLEIHQEQVIQPAFIPDGAVFKGYKPYDVQDIIFRTSNTRFKLARWRLPDGTYVSGQLPQGIHGHYGSELIVYILHQYFTCRVTEPLLLAQLHARGVLISAGQLSNILTHDKDAFHAEKSELMPAGTKACNQILTDDTGGRHKGQNQYTNIMGNKWFTVFNTTDSKSRVNFFRLLQSGKHEYLINEDAVAYLRGLNAPDYLPGYIALSQGLRFTALKAWEEFLASRNIISDVEVRLVTEAALCASVIDNGMPRDLGVHGDDAGQFDAFVRSLCWIHEERHYRKIIPTTAEARADLEKVRDKIWAIYNALKAYQQDPNDTAKQAIGKQFDDLFLHTTTTSSTLNKRLRMTYAKKKELLLVLERPTTPLHNNSSESDARAAVTKRKVSGGTRSDAGQESRDTFLSLQQTCRKLGINFIAYLKDRVCGLYEIARLAEIIRWRSSKSPQPAEAS